ncbi:MAG: helix-turn-helix domain-containing protein [Myxococcaceae bacterium]
MDKPSKIEVDLEAFGASFRSMRRELKRTQVELSKRAGVSRDTLHRLERGGVVDTRSLMRLLAALGQRLRIEPRPSVRAADMRRRFVHLHEDAE